MTDLLLGPRREPRKALEPQQTGERPRARSAAKGRVQTLWMEGPHRTEEEARDAVLDRLGRVLVLARLLEPLRVLRGLLHAEARLAEQRRWRKHRVLGADDLRRWSREVTAGGEFARRRAGFSVHVSVPATAQVAARGAVSREGGGGCSTVAQTYLGRRVGLAQEGLECTELRLGHQVDLVDEQEVGELELVAQQVGDSALLAVNLVPAAIDERLHRRELLKDGGRVDNGHEVV